MYGVNMSVFFRHVHGGATAAMIDSINGTHATYVCGPVMTANLNINYRK